MQAVCKDSSSTTKLPIVFDSSAKSSTRVLLNDQLLIGPMVHSPLVDVLLRFRFWATDISWMYRAILLPEVQCHLHCFVWRSNERNPFKDYKMTRLVFGVPMSSFATNTVVKQNAIVHEDSHPWGTLAVRDYFYVDDWLTGTNSLSEATELQNELQDSFNKGEFLLRIWKSNEPVALCHLPPHLVDIKSSHNLPMDSEFTKVVDIK